MTERWEDLFHIDVDGPIHFGNTKLWEINIWLEDESNYCQVFVQDDGKIVFKPKDQIDGAVRIEVME